MREIRMLRATWRGLETWHVERPAGAPVLDPTKRPVQARSKRHHLDLDRLADVVVVLNCVAHIVEREIHNSGIVDVDPYG